MTQIDEALEGLQTVLEYVADFRSEGGEDDGLTNGKECIEAILKALEGAGMVIVPRELDSKDMSHWKVASEGIKCIEQYGGDFGSDHTPERQIADAYKEMIRAMLSASEGE